MSSNHKWDERVLRRLKLRDLRVLLAIAETGSMGKTAAQLAISQPAISKAIGEIEHVVGVRLLNRTPQGVEPTLYGRALIKWGIAVFDDLRQAMQEIGALSDPGSGEVRLGTTGIHLGFTPAVIDQFLRQYRGPSWRFFLRRRSQTSTWNCANAVSTSSSDDWRRRPLARPTSTPTSCFMIQCFWLRPSGLSGISGVNLSFRSAQGAG